METYCLVKQLIRDRIKQTTNLTEMKNLLEMLEYINLKIWGYESN